MKDEPTYTDESSLELPADSLENTTIDIPPEKPEKKVSRKARIIKFALIFIGILLTLGSIAMSTVLRSGKSTNKSTQTSITINTQTLDNGTLNTLTKQTTGGQVRQQLTITPNTLFINNVEVQSALSVGNDLSVSGDFSVKGTTTLQGAVGINSNLAVSGGLTVGGTLSAGGLSVGSLAATGITVSGSVNFGGHLVPTGDAPSARPSVAALGGTVRIDGNDTAGTITITTGGGAPFAGEMAIITFRAGFATTPKVQITPINSNASTLNYYATRSTKFFTVDTSSAPANGTEYVFDYLVTQ